MKTNGATNRFRAIVMAMAMAQVLALVPFSSAVAMTENASRWRNDDGSEVTATWAAAENTAITGLAKNTGRRVRFGLAEDSNDKQLLRQAAEYLGIEENIASAVVDTVNGYAYFGMETAPARIVKVALGSGAAAPTRVGTVVLNAGENYAGTAVIDTANGYAYFGTYTAPARIVKVALGSGAAAPTRTGAVTLDSGEDRLWSAAIDATNGYAYFGTKDTVPAVVVKVALGSGAAAPTRTGAVTLNSGENDLLTAAIDTGNGYAYFGTDTAPGIVVKVALGSGAAAPTRTGAVTLNSGEDNLRSAVIDTGNGYAYFGTTPGIVVKVALGSGAAAPTRTGAVTLNASESNLRSAVIDTGTGYAYFGTYTTTARVVKVALGSGAAAPTRTAAVSLDGGHGTVRTGVIDSTNGYAYFGTDNTPGNIIKVDLSTMTRVGELVLNAGEGPLRTSVIDVANGYAYFGTGGTPATVVKVALGSGAAAPTRVGAVVLDSGEDDLYSAVIDTANGYAYFGTNTSPQGIVVKVALGSGAAAPTRVGAVTLNSGEEYLYSAVIDATNGYAYFGTDTTPQGIVVKVALGSGAAAPTRTGAVTLNSGEEYLESAVIDTDLGYAFFGTWSDPAYVVKVALGSGAAAPTRVSAAIATGGETYFQDAAIDRENGYAYFATGDGPALVSRYYIGITSSTLTYVDALTLTTGESNAEVMLVDATNGYGYVGTAVGPSAGSGFVKISIPAQYEFVLEYAAKGASCAASTGWTAVTTDGSGHWTLHDSSNIAESGGLTTNVASGVADGGSSFVAGRIIDAAPNKTAWRHYDTGEFTEMEWSLKATASATDGTAYCFRVTDEGSATSFTYTSYAQATLSGTAPTQSTTSNKVVLGRAQKSTSTTADVYFTLGRELSGTVTVTFPAGFTVGDPTGGSACLSALDSSGQTVTATKTACDGPIAITGIPVTLPSTAGAYEISWVNDDPGEVYVYILDDDTITVSGTVAPSVTFDVGAQTAACAYGSLADVYTVSLGTLSSATVTTSVDQSGSGTSGVRGVCLQLDTNAANGAIVTVKSDAPGAGAEGGLASSSVTGDYIPANSGSVAAGTSEFGTCLNWVSSAAATPDSRFENEGDWGDADGTLGGVEATETSSTCAGGAHGTSTALTGSTQSFLTTGSDAVSQGLARLLLKASIAGTQPAHNDYTTDLTFVATATY